MEIIKSNKGGIKICYEGYMYTKQIEKNASIRWRCASRTTGCKGTMTTTDSMENPTPLNTHKHVPDENAIKVTKCRLKMKEKAATSRAAPTQIYAEAVQEVDDNVRASLPDETTCKRTMRNSRKDSLPPNPATLQELVLEDEWTMTGGTNPKPFMMYDNGPQAEARIIIYATDQGLKLLSQSQQWFMDGNFSMSPQHFAQLYVIRVKLGETAVSAVYAFLQRKNQETYEELFQAVLDRCQDLGYFPFPESVMIDFETACIQAITAVFGEEIEIRCCFFHLTKSTWRKVQGLGLTNHYKENLEFSLFCGMMDSLALLPLDDVQQGMQYLQDNCPPEAENLLKYFDETYVNGTTRRGQRIGAPQRYRSQRIPPKFKPELWNVHLATLNNDPRTNNLCESWNHKFYHLVGHQHPTIWRAIRSLQMDQATVETAILQDEIGNPPKKRTHRKYKELQVRLRTLCNDYVAGRKDMGQFLKGAGHNVHSGREFS